MHWIVGRMFVSASIRVRGPLFAGHRFTSTEHESWPLAVAGRPQGRKQPGREIDHCVAHHRLLIAAATTVPILVAAFLVLTDQFTN
jgi:hypothetical protein